MSSARSVPSISKPYGERPRYYDVSHYKSEGDIGKYQTDGDLGEHKEVTLHRSEQEGFGFVILSSSHRIGSTIGMFVRFFMVSFT